MRSRTAPALALLVLVAAAGCAEDEPAAAPAPPATASASPSSAPPSKPSAKPSRPATATPTSRPTGSPTSPPSQPATSPPSQPATGATASSGAEMPPTDDTTSSPALPGLDPSPGSLVRTPLPSADTARGALAKGYPESMRPLGGSRVETSSVAPSGSRLQVALEATTTAPAQRVLLAYRTRFARLSMVEETVSAVEGSQAAGFTRDGSSVVVTVRREGGRTTYTVYGVLVAG
jgi:hypothetical protein